MKFHYNIEFRLAKGLKKSPEKSAKLSSRVDSGSTPMLSSDKSFPSTSSKFQYHNFLAVDMIYGKYLMQKKKKITEVELLDEGMLMKLIITMQMKAKARLLLMPSTVLNTARLNFIREY